MQVIRLVEPGVPDKMIMFDELPKNMLSGAEKISPKALGLPRHWEQYGDHYTLYFKNVNKDKMMWEEICGFVPRNVARDLRLRDDISLMAVKTASTSNERMAIEPEDVPVIKIEIAKEEVDAKHAKNCVSEGRGGKYTDGCPRCEQLSKNLVGVGR